MFHCMNKGFFHLVIFPHHISFYSNPHLPTWLSLFDPHSQSLPQIWKLNASIAKTINLQVSWYRVQFFYMEAHLRFCFLLNFKIQCGFCELQFSFYKKEDL